MKKNFIIAALAVICLVSVENAVFFNRECNVLKNRLRHLACERNDLQDDVRDLENRCAHFREVIDSIDNPHHHDYLTSLQAFRALDVSQ